MLSLVGARSSLCQSQLMKLSLRRFNFPSPNVWKIVNRLLESMGDEDELPSIDDSDFLEEMRRRRQESSDSIPWLQLRDEN